jgi:hypothetical protein
VSLRQQAAADLRLIVEDPGGFGTPITVTSPDGVTAVLVGNAADIDVTIDPETGQAVKGRKITVALTLASLAAAGLGIPSGTEDGTVKPWLVTYADALGATRTYKVAEALPDRELPLVVCVLESYRTGVPL